VQLTQFSVDSFTLLYKISKFIEIQHGYSNDFQLTLLFIKTRVILIEFLSLLGKPINFATVVH